MTMSRREQIGVGLIVTGLLIFAICFIATATYEVSADIPALGMVGIVSGAVVYSPDLLKDDTKATSSMRVIAFGLTALFAVFFVRQAWHAQKVADLSLDTGWTALLSAAIAGKAIQSFSENRPPAPPAQPDLDEKK